jgi:anti-sigma factor RsiW
MTERCADLDEFFDGELAADQADAFREHLATCERCQCVLHGRMQENVVVRVPAHLEQPGTIQAMATGTTTPVLAARKPPEAAPAMARDLPGAARPWGCARALAYAVPLVAAAAVIPLWLGRGEPAFELAVAVDRAPGTDRNDRTTELPGSISVHPGDVLRPTVRGARSRAIWVYAGERGLVAACPGADRCSDKGGELTLELALTTHGKYTIVALGSGDPLPTPGATLDQTRAAARRAGIETRLQRVEVE